MTWLIPAARVVLSLIGAAALLYVALMVSAYWWLWANWGFTEIWWSSVLICSVIGAFGATVLWLGVSRRALQSLVRDMRMMVAGGDGSGAAH